MTPPSPDAGRTPNPDALVAAWVETACRRLGLDPAEAGDHDAVLEVARAVAHQVVRPAAPVTTYLLGLAVGRGADPGEAAAALGSLAEEWGAADPTVE